MLLYSDHLDQVSLLSSNENPFKINNKVRVFTYLL